MLFRSTIKATAYDAKGNVKTAERKVTVNEDTTKPSVSISFSPSSVIAGNPVTVTIKGSDNAAVTKIDAEFDGVQIKLDDTGKCVIIPENAGTPLVKAKAYDKAGNVGEAEKPLNVIADTSKPSVSIATTTSSLAVGNSFTITVTTSDNVGVVKVETDINGTPITLDENNKYTYQATQPGDRKSTRLNSSH